MSTNDESRWPARYRVALAALLTVLVVASNWGWQLPPLSVLAFVLATAGGLAIGAVDTALSGVEGDTTSLRVALFVAVAGIVVAGFLLAPSGVHDAVWVLLLAMLWSSAGVEALGLTDRIADLLGLHDP